MLAHLDLLHQLAKAGAIASAVLPADADLLSALRLMI